ncbi:hypothetical protein RFI_18501, partial [Reticulomyxa filosa]
LFSNENMKYGKMFLNIAMECWPIIRSPSTHIENNHTEVVKMVELMKHSDQMIANMAAQNLHDYVRIDFERHLIPVVYVICTYMYVYTYNKHLTCDSKKKKKKKKRSSLISPMRDFEQYQVEYLEITVKALKEIMNSLREYLRKKESLHPQSATADQHFHKRSNTGSTGSIEAAVTVSENYWSPALKAVSMGSQEPDHKSIGGSGDDDNEEIPYDARLVQLQTLGSMNQFLPTLSSQRSSVVVTTAITGHENGLSNATNVASTNTTRATKKASVLFNGMEDSKDPSLREMWPHIRQLMEGYILLWYCHPDDQ